MSVITLIIAVVTIGWLYKTFAVNLLEEQSAETNILLSKIIHNGIHIGIETKLGVKNLFNPESIQFISDQKNHQFLTTIIRDSIEETPIVKVKIYNSKLKTIYSTIEDNIGKIMDNDNIKKVNRTGESITAIQQYDVFTLNDQLLKNVTLSRTLIPMQISHEMTSADMKDFGIFEIYVDVTERYQSIINSQWGFVGVITLVLLVIYGILYFEVRRINLITAKKQQDLDNELRKAEKTNLVLGKNFAKVATKRDRAVKENEAKSQFLANMSHELRTPLNAIIGYSEMISDDMEDGNTDRVKEDSGRINSAGKHLLVIINDILDISKIEAGKMELNIEKFNIKDMVEEVIATSRPLVDINNNKLFVMENNFATTIHSDLTRTRQILLNLISNASKFTKDGEIVVSVNDSTIDDQKAIEFVVQDTGIGVDEKYIDKIFSPFNQADLSSSKKYKGTGLGLTISKLFCELMNGQISVNSELGHGATFSVKIPIRVSKNNSLLSDSDAKHVHGEFCAKVLIIDNDPVTREQLTSYLSDLKFYVITASTGLDGLRVAQKENIDIIILDVQLSGLDGRSVLNALKKDSNTKNCHFVLSSSSDEQNITKSVGVDAYVTKPYSREIVEEVFCNIVGGSDSVVSI